MDCVFCSIINDKIPSKKVYEDDVCLAIHEIAPQAPVHILVFPKAHIKSADDINTSNSSVISHIFECIPTIAKAVGLTDGYRIISNCGEDAGQSIAHIHFHILGGKNLGVQIV